jgi:hypothetical protein
MERPGTTSKTLFAQRRQARLAAELRSNLVKRKQQARRRRQLEGATAPEAGAADAASAPKGPGEPEGGPA